MRWAAASIAILTLVACFVGLRQSDAPARAPLTVKVDDDFFNPDRKRIRKGRRVEFRWVGNHDHNVTKVSGPGRHFASETTDRRGVNFAKRFRRAGLYRLTCTIHDGMRMRLRVRRP